MSKLSCLIFFAILVSVLAVSPCIVNAKRSECDVLATSIMGDRWNLTTEQFIKAQKVCLKLAEQGDSEAQYHVGGLHTVHVGNIYPNDAEMFKWMKLSAENGYARAQSFLGRSYETGKTFPHKKDIGLAVKWHTLAAEQHDFASMVRLEEIYRKGLLGIQIDLEKADFWRKEMEKKK